MKKSFESHLERRISSQKSVGTSHMRTNLDEQRKQAQSGSDIEHSTELQKPVVTNPDKEAFTEDRVINRDTFKDEKGKRLSVDLPETVFRAVAVYCATNGVTRAELTFDLFVKHLVNEGFLK